MIGTKLRRRLVQMTRWMRGASLSRRAVLIAGVAAILSSILLLLSFNEVLDRYFRPRWLRAFAAAHPGVVLQVAGMEYQLRRNVTVCRVVSVTSSNGAWGGSLKSLSLSGVPWINVLLGERRPSKVLRQTIVDAQGITFQFPGAQYRLECQEARADLPRSGLVLRGVELRPQQDDATFFAARAHRRARMIATIPEVRVKGVNGLDLLEQKSYRATSIRLEKPVLHVLINRDKPRNPKPFKFGTPREALGAIHETFEVDEVAVEDGRILLSETVGSERGPGTMTFDSVRLASTRMGNAVDSTKPLAITGEALLMNSGLLKGAIHLPLNGGEPGFSYDVSLGPMDLRLLNSFLGVAGRSRIDSGMVQSARCEVQVVNGRAQGRFEGRYRDLEITVVDRETGSETGVVNRLKTAFVNRIALRRANPDKSGVARAGKVDYARQPEDKFLPFLWKGIRSGMLDLLGLDPYVKTERPKREH